MRAPLLLTAVAAYLHPAFPWEGPNGQGEGITILITALLAPAVV